MDEEGPCSFCGAPSGCVCRYLDTGIDRMVRGARLIIAASQDPHFPTEGPFFTLAKNLEQILATYESQLINNMHGIPFPDVRTEEPHILATSLRRAVLIWRNSGLNGETATRLVQEMCVRVGDGESPREAFRAANLNILIREQPWCPKSFSGVLARRLGLDGGTDHLITRLAGTTHYTEFVRGIIEGWAQEHRNKCQEFPETDLYYDPRWEDLRHANDETAGATGEVEGGQ